jgi:hypothetical protein
MDAQQELLSQQYTSIKNAKTIDVNKMKTSVSNAYKQYMIMVKDALKKVNDIFSNSALPVSDKDPQLKQEVLSTYSRLSTQLADTMTTDEFSQYLSDVSEFMSLAASSVIASTPSSSLPQASSA